MFEGIKIRHKKRLIELQKLEIVEQQLESVNQQDLHKDSDESQWLLLGGTSEDGKSLGSTELSTMRAQAIEYYYKNSYGKNIVRSFEKYIVGRDFKVVPHSALEQVQDEWDNFWKINKLDLKKKEIIRRTMITGECFIRFFNTDYGYKIRFMSPDAISAPEVESENDMSGGIETSKEDYEEIINYWYNNKAIPPEEVVHIKILVDSDVKRGRSVLEAAMEYIAMYNKWLKDRMKLNMVRATVGLVKKVSGTPSQAAAISTGYDTNRSSNPDGTYMTKAPKGVSVFTTTKGVDYEMIAPNLQASDVHHDGQQILLAICASVGLPEYMVTSDSSNSNYASTLIAEAPGVMEFQDWQDFFGFHFEEIFNKVIQNGIDKGRIPATEQKTEKTTIYNSTLQRNITVDKTITINTPTACDVLFPEIVHREIEKETKAIIEQDNAGYISKTTACSKLDYDYNREKELMQQEEEEYGEEDDEYSLERKDGIDVDNGTE